MILDDIVAHKKRELKRRKRAVPLAALKESIGLVQTSRPFQKALTLSPDLALIAEIKQASPSAGRIRKDVEPVEIGRLYEDSGAAAVSVLTDERFFHGSLASVKQVKDAVSIPVLRKDFIIDPYQIYESRAFGADAVLLIVAVLSDDELPAFLSLCRMLGLEALVEAHTASERNRALEAGADVIGINNRDLTTFTVDLSTTMRLVADIPEGVTTVSESGIKTRDDVERLREAGVDALLVGTALMAEKDIRAKIRDLLALNSQG
jgi:indole-3-glycerol phosphate synthase